MKKAKPGNLNSRLVRVQQITVTLLALAVFLAMVCAGCSGNKQQAGIVELRLTMWGTQEDADFYNMALKEFYREHPNIRVKLEIIPWVRVFDKLLISTAGGRCPDVSRISSNWFVPCAAKGLLEPLDSYIANDPEFDIEDFYRPALEGWGMYKGKIYALPGDIDVYAMYYNKDMFDKYGVPYPDESWNWDTYLRMAKKLTKDLDGDGRLDQWGCNPDSTWQAYVWQNGGDILNADQTKCILDRPEAYEAIQWMADLRQKHHVAPLPSDTADIGAQKLFTNGKIGMFISGSWAAPMVFQKEIKTFDWDVAPVPKGKVRAVFIGGGAFGVLSRSKHKKEAWELVKFMVSPTMQRHYAQTKHIIPSRRSVAESGAYLYLKDKPKNKKVFIEAISYGHPLPRVPCSREMNDLIANEITWAILGKKTAKEACETVTPRINDLLMYQRR